MTMAISAAEAFLRTAHSVAEVKDYSAEAARRDRAAHEESIEQAEREDTTRDGRPTTHFHVERDGSVRRLVDAPEPVPEDAANRPRGFSVDDLAVEAARLRGEHRLGRLGEQEDIHTDHGERLGGSVRRAIIAGEIGRINLQIETEPMERAFDQMREAMHSLQRALSDMPVNMRVEGQ